MKTQASVPVIRLRLVITALVSLVVLQPNAMAEPETWYNCLTREVFTPEKQAWCDRWQTLQTATYTVPTSLAPNADYTTVTLEHGRYQRDDGRFIVELVNQQGWDAFGDLNGDGKTDAAVIFGVALDPNGREVATYLTAVLDVDGVAQALTPIHLGERILLGDALTIRNSRINLPFLTQTELIQRAFVVEGTTLSELAASPAPIPPISTQSEGTLVFSQTARYAIRIFSESGSTRLNLYNKETATPELFSVPLTVEPTADGVLYRFDREPSVQLMVATSGAQTLKVNGSIVNDFAQVTGTVTYRPRIALPPDAVVEVTLVEVSRADAAAVTLSSQTIVVGNRQVPIPFALVYDAGQIEPHLRYAVQARITVDGQLRFITTTYTGVITQGNPTDVEVMVDPVSR